MAYVNRNILNVDENSCGPWDDPPKGSDPGIRGYKTIVRGFRTSSTQVYFG
jgi:hypothetical protein